MNREIPTPYTFEEASTFGHGFPDRGIKCYKCKTLIPQFEAMDFEKTEEWKSILKSKGDEAADQYLMSLTGCNYRWAKIWRLHPNGPNAKTEKEASFEPGTKCPFCGNPLRTKNAKQCPHCFKSWRNESA